MKEIQFKHIQIQNFLSIGKNPIEVEFKKGLNVITGINRDKEDSKNGVGKSAIADAIFFAIFGNTLRPIKRDNISNWKTKRDCKVILHFNVIENFIETEYILIRTLLPSRIQLFKNGDDVSRTVVKTTEMVSEAISTSPEMFEQSVLMSLNQTEPFLAKKGATKRNFIEGIFKLTVFSEMLMIIRHDLNETKRLYDLEKAKIDEIQNVLKAYKKQQIEQKETRQLRLTELNQRFEKNKSDAEELSNKTTLIDKNLITNIEEKLLVVKAKEVELVNQEREHLQKNATIQAAALNLKNSITEIERLGNVCITCRRPWTETDKETHKCETQKHKDELQKLNLEIGAINKLMADVINRQKKCSEALNTLVTGKHELKLTIKENENLAEQIKQREIWNKQVQVDIQSIETQQDTFDTLITEQVARVEALNKNSEIYKNKLDLLDIAKFVVSEEGVKSFIVKKMLKMLNGKLNYYLKELEANCICKFDEFFEEVILNEKGEACSYFNFSGGERKRIDLAMLFTFMDIRRLQSNVSVNIAVYDELFDSSLDSKGIECVLEILKNRVNLYNEAVYIISHKSEAVEHATGEVIYLEKHNETTERIEYGTQI